MKIFKNIRKKNFYLTIFILLILCVAIYFYFNTQNPKNTVEKLLDKCNIKINGTNPQDIIVHDDRFYKMVLSSGELGLAESYMYKYWSSNNLYETLYLLSKNFNKLSYIDFNFNDFLNMTKSYLFNNQTIEKALVDVQSHYDIGNDLYTRMLDNNMQYTCAFFQDTNDLNTAQEQKMDLIGQKLNLKPGDTLLDIGCGWGYLINYLSKKYNVQGLGITLSEEQLKYAEINFKNNSNASYKLMDYRNIPKDMKFTKIVSVGMLEHVGNKNYEEYFDIVHDHLTDDGIALIHTIGCQNSLRGISSGSGSGSKFIDKYIFPNGHIPTWDEISPIVSKKFLIQDWQNFGKYYDNTLQSWYKNINSKWDEIPNYDEKFKRMWNFYLLGCAANFNLCHMNLWQILITKSCNKLPRRDCLIKY
jgi:cyclopropane-fatty-acyl-phospholipid synthase